MIAKYVSIIEKNVFVFSCKLLTRFNGLDLK